MSVYPAAEKQTGPFQNLTFEGFFAGTQWDSSLYQVTHISFMTFCKTCGQTEQYNSKAKIFNILQNTVILGNSFRKVVCNNIKSINIPATFLSFLSESHLEMEGFQKTEKN